MTVTREPFKSGSSRWFELFSQGVVAAVQRCRDHDVDGAVVLDISDSVAQREKDESAAIREAKREA